MKRVTLGPFVLEHRIGQGGMAEVWRAVHEGDDVAVAVKVMTAERARRPRSHLQFRQEARAMARLDHAHIVRVHDAGVVSQQAAAASEGALLTNMPYVVMDLLPGGSLWRYRGRLAWNDLRNLVHVLLDALAHAHARGVIHRDLKPANVLLSPERRAVISDFGLAHLPGASDVVLRAGTPSYMAPEQFLDRWRDFGPWTDLYGFGCLVWTLVAGTPPFRRKGWEDTRDAHLNEDLPKLVPLQPMPEELEDWLRGLLCKDPARRTQCAADAAWALDRIDPDDLETGDLLSLVEPDDSLDTQIPLLDPSTVTFGPAPAFSPSLPWSVGRNDAPPPPPTDWRIPDQLHRLHLRGAGLGLLGARGMPTVGREEERDAIWRALVQVHRLPLARAVLLEGAAGTGRSHLARWLAQRAQEVGAATALFVEHGLRGAQASGLAGMLRAHFGTEGLDPGAAMGRVTEVARSYGTIDPRDQRILAEMVAEEETASGEEAGASTPERMAALSRHLCAVGARRPVVLVIDDAHRGIDALLFARWVLRRRETEPTPVLIVLVLQDEGLGRSGPARELVAQVTGCEGVQRLRVHPLPDAELLVLIRELVGLEGELARRVAARTAGNPAFAVSLVEDWVARGILERAEGGFRLRAGADAPLPDGLHELWATHLQLALSGYGEKVWQALELAAVLGERVHTAEWQRICARAALHPNLDAVDDLVGRRLVVSSHPARTWRFVQGMVRESLLRRAREGRRLALHHRWIVEDLELRQHVDDQRMARHLLGAGRVAEGVERLVRAARTIGAQGNPHGVLDLCDQAERALELASDELKARWRGPIALFRGRALLVLGRLEEAEAAALRVGEVTTAEQAEHFEARTVLCTVWMLRGDLDTARDHLLDLVAELRQRKLDKQLAHALRSLGVTLHHLGDLDGALRVGMEARALARDAESWPTWAEATTQVAGSLIELGRAREAGRVADEGLAHRDRIHPAAVASLLNVRAEVDRRQGRFDAAVPRYEESLDILDRIGSLEAVLPRLNLATIHALQGRYGEAFRLAERCRRESALQRRAPLELSVRSVLLVASLGLSDRKGADEHASRILELAKAGVTCESDGYALIGLGCRLLRERDEELAERLSAVVVDWAYGRGRQHAQEIASLIGEQ